VGQKGNSNPVGHGGQERLEIKLPLQLGDEHSLSKRVGKQDRGLGQREEK